MTCLKTASLTLCILSLVALGVAQNQTVSLFLPGVDPQSLVGSIVGGDATATTYVIECANGGSNAAATTTAAAATTDLAAAISGLGDDGSDECGYPVPVTLVEGPSTAVYSLAIDDSTASVNCVLSGTSVAVCTAYATGALFTDASVAPSSAGTLSGTDVSFLPVVITAGSVTNTASTPASTTASTTGGAKQGGSTSPTSSANSNGGTQSQTGSTTGPATKASGAAMHVGPAMGMGAAGALAAVAAVVL